MQTDESKTLKASSPYGQDQEWVSLLLLPHNPDVSLYLPHIAKESSSCS